MLSIWIAAVSIIVLTLAYSSAIHCRGLRHEAALARQRALVSARIDLATMAADADFGWPARREDFHHRPSQRLLRLYRDAA